MATELRDNEKLQQILGINDSDDVNAYRNWNEAQAQTIAESMGIQLTDEHWEVIRFLRIHYENVGNDMPPAREFSQTLDERFMDKGGLRYLYGLFPDGPITQGGRVAGIGIPADAVNRSFGSVH